MSFEQAHQQRQLESNEHADRKDKAEQHELEVLKGAKGEKQDRRRRTADDRHCELDLDETSCEVRLDASRDPRADAHRRQIEADDEGELGDRVTEEVTAERAGQQLVDEAANRDDEDVQIERARTDRR
jgi:hypothetical protein